MPETRHSDASTYRARPVVTVDGQRWPRVDELLIGMRLEEAEGGLSSMELEFSMMASLDDGGAELAFAPGPLKLGAALVVAGGDEEQPQILFRGRISGLEERWGEGAPSLVVLAEDALMGARMLRCSKVHSDLRADDLVRRVASALGLEADVEGLAAPLGTWVQLNESDLAFLRRVLRRQGADLAIIGGKLSARPTGEIHRGELELRLHGLLRRVTVLADLSQQASAVTASGWDPARGARVQARSRAAGLGPGSGRTGAELLEQRLSARDEHLGDQSFLDHDDAQRAVDAAWFGRARAFVTVEGTAEGHPGLRVGTHLRLRGLSPRFDNTYAVTSALHRYDLANGYETDFRACSAFVAEDT